METKGCSWKWKSGSFICVITIFGKGPPLYKSLASPSQKGTVCSVFYKYIIYYTVLKPNIIGYFIVKAIFGFCCRTFRSVVISFRSYIARQPNVFGFFLVQIIWFTITNQNSFKCEKVGTSLVLTLCFFSSVFCFNIIWGVLVRKHRSVNSPIKMFLQMCLSGDALFQPFPCSHNKGILGSPQVSNWDIPQVETVAPSFIFSVFLHFWILFFPFLYFVFLIF